MKLWLVKVGEPLPCEAGRTRLLRLGMLAEVAVAAGHEVTWWSSDFDHRTKSFRHGRTMRFAAGGIDYLLLHGCGYRRHVGWRRWSEHHRLAAGFTRLASSLPRPDLMLVALPIPELAEAAIRWARSAGVPSLVDIRDLWPDALADLLPSWMGAVADHLVAPLDRISARACAGATGLIGITPPFLAWGLRHARRCRTANDAVIPHAYPGQSVTEGDRSAALARWRAQGVGLPGQRVVAFLGSFIRSFDLETVVAAARLREAEGDRDLRVVLCGDGDRYGRIAALAAGCPAVVLPGWVDRAGMEALLSIAAVGLAPYRTNRNFRGTISNKPIEYLAAGLPIATCLDGYLRRILDEHHLGWYYPEGDAVALARLLAGSAMPGPDQVGRCRRFFEGRFAADQVMGRFLRHLEAVATAGRQEGW